MTPDLDNKLREKYPIIFSNGCEISINDGWFDIVDVLCYNIQSFIDGTATQRQHTIEWNDKVNDPSYDWSAHPFIKRKERKVPELIEQVFADQIKEKFGTLRFYYVGGDDYVRGLVDMAESISGRTCEDCGNVGMIREGMHIRTLCDFHASTKGNAYE